MIVELSIWGRLLSGVRLISIEGQGVCVEKRGCTNRLSFPALHLEINITKSIFFNTMQCGELRITHLSSAKCKQLIDALQASRLKYWQAQLPKEHSTLINALSQFDEWKKSLRRYIRQKDLEKLLNLLSGGVEALNYLDDYPLVGLAVPEETQDLIEFIQNSDSRRRNWNDQWMLRQQSRHAALFDGLENHPLTEPQRQACVADEENVLVLAGAGTGKTSTMRAKAAYLVQAGLAKPDEILLLAFGRDARAELAERVHATPGLEKVEVSTFHALGMNILRLGRNRAVGVSGLATDERQLPKFIDLGIEELFSNPSFKDTVRQYFGGLLFPFPNDLEFKSKGHYFRYLKDNEIRTMQGEDVKSFEELEIANYLFMQGIEYQYEHRYKIDTATPDRRAYCPDFYLPQLDLYIEHFGIDENGNTATHVDAKDYLEGMEWKRALHKTYQTNLIETYSYENKKGGLTVVLERKLEEFCKGREKTLDDYRSQRSDKDLFGKLKELGTLSSFSKLVAAFLTAFKSSSHELDDLQPKTTRNLNDLRFQVFLSLFKPIYDRYQSVLEANDTIDFSDMIREALHHVREGNYVSPYKYIMVDEFQDISPLRAELIKAMKAQQPECALFCVGDDWQAIYRFTGSDVTLTTSFAENFGATEEIALDKTFRFNNRISDVASSFVVANPMQKRKVLHTNAVSDRTEVHVIREDDKGVALGKALNVIAEDSGGRNATVFLLARFGDKCRPDNLDQIQRSYHTLNIEFLTAHSSKGSEADYVVVLDVVKGKYGFPSLVNSDPILERVLPGGDDFLHAEERRLFYVAMTRARNRVYLLTAPGMESEFIQELERDGYDVAFSRSKLSAEVSFSAACPECLSGTLTHKKVGDWTFYRCTYHPRCKERAPVCSKCGAAPLVRGVDFHRCANPDCDQTLPTCPQCGSGFLSLRKGKYGLFWGCSNYRQRAANSCDATFKKDMFEGHNSNDERLEAS